MTTLPALLSFAKNLPVDMGHNEFSDSVIQQVDKRDRHKCKFCGWEEPANDLRRYVSLLGVYDKAQLPKSVVTSCLICDLSLRITMTAKRESGQVAYLPEWSQTQLANIFRAMYLIKRMGPEAQDLVSAIECLEDHIQERILEVPRYLGITGYSLSSFADAIAEMPEENYKRRGLAFGPLRVIPTQQFLEHVVGDRWDSLLKNYPLESIEHLKEQVKHAATDL